MLAVETLCRVLGASRSAYYEWQAQKKRNSKDEKKVETEALILSIFWEHRRRYGVRRIIAELRARDSKASVHLVRKALNSNGLKAIQPRSFVPRTTDSRHPYPIIPASIIF